MCPKTFLYVTRSPVLRVQLDGPKVVDVFWVEEHVPHRGSFTVQFEGVTGEHYAFGNDSRRV